ncbi:hypothetical protein CBR_g52316 [Chara braunii]|uniref:Reverse transcriptase domain-containing protein n=1 Tax=Chara braunii TaxID=69332 RepID=A0A388K6Q9_CHABU|nr:hypothetical protein CBR_g52316 [Chara braunii]|eukprot:GBG65721.1 hypothetical protein CBR_g52316 [Chara braunii]
MFSPRNRGGTFQSTANLNQASLIQQALSAFGPWPIPPGCTYPVPQGGYGVPHFIPEERSGYGIGANGSTGYTGLYGGYGGMAMGNGHGGSFPGGGVMESRNCRGTSRGESSRGGEAQGAQGMMGLRAHAGGEGMGPGGHTGMQDGHGGRPSETGYGRSNSRGENSEPRTGHSHVTCTGRCSDRGPIRRKQPLDKLLHKNFEIREVGSGQTGDRRRGLASTEGDGQGKASGCDGMPTKLYLELWPGIGAHLVEIYNQVLEGKRRSVSMCKGVISVLFKKGDRTKIRNSRPVSLLNISYKILAKILARRLGRYLPELVKVDQAAFVRGRSIFDNIVTAIETLETVQREDLNIMVLLLDLEKTYDRVNWLYVLTTLKWMDFGRNFVTWVKTLYIYSTAAVMINGKQSEEFPLTRLLR